VNGILTKDVSSADVTLTTLEAGNGIYRFTGTLTGNRIVTIPNTGHPFVAENLTTTGDSFTLTLKAAGQTPSISLLRGKPASGFCDGTGVYATTSSPGLGYSNIATAAVDTALTLSNVGGLFVQSGAGRTTTLPKASTIPAGLGVAVQMAAASSIALNGTDTATGITMPYSGVLLDTFFFVSDGVSNWKLQFYANKTTPKFDTSVSAPRVLAGGVTDDGVTSLQASTTHFGNLYGTAKPNLVVNGSGELGLVGWTAGPSALSVVTDSDGTYFKGAANGVSTTNSWSSAPFPVSPNQIHSAQAEVQVDAGATGTYYVDVLYYSTADGSGAAVLDGSNSLLSATDGAWHSCQGTDSAAPANALSARVRIVVTSATWTTLKFRRVKVEQNAVRSVYSQEATIAQALSGNSPVIASGGLTFPDGSQQTTAQGLTQATSVRYLVGATDTVGSFAAGDTSLRTGGFVAPYVEILRNGDELYQGIHYTLNADGIHINGLDPLLADEDLLIKTKFPYNPSTVYAPNFQPLTVAAGATTIPFAHVQGCALLAMNGALLDYGTDYTDDANNFYLAAAAGGEKYGVLNLNPITIANMLANVNPVIASGVLQFADGTQQNSAALPSGQCYLSLVGGNLVLARKNGNKLSINGKLYAIPAAGVSLAVTGATASTLYYIYAYMNGTTMTLERVTTGHSTDANTGVEIKTGDPSRTLVGMAYCDGTGNWRDDSANRMVASYFNRKARGAFGNIGTVGGITTTSYGSDVGSGMSAVTWADELVISNLDVTLQNNTGSAVTYAVISIDGVATTSSEAQYQPYANSAFGMGTAKSRAFLSEGLHGFQIKVRVSSNTGTVVSGVLDIQSAG
jgi:hypothetical protein